MCPHKVNALERLGRVLRHALEQGGTYGGEAQWCYSGVTVMSQWCHTVVTLGLHNCHTVVTLLSHCRYAVATLLFH
jgi:hypothetical protein